MAKTTFVDRQTPIIADWLNDVNDLTYGGSPFTAAPGFWPDVTPTVEMHRMDGRLFVGDAVECTGNNTGTQNGPVPDGTVGANWAIRDGQFVSFASNGNIGVVGFTRSQDTTREPCPAIGVAGFAIGNFATRSTWGLYSDVQFEQGPYAYGLEIAVKNKTANNETSTPYFATSGTYGIWLPAGGDNAYGGSAVNPNNTAIAIGKNASTWNKGIVFFATSLTGTDGVTGTATAIEMAKGHRVVWRAPGNFTGFSIRSDVSAASSDVAMTATNNNITFSGSGGGGMFQMSHATGGVNYLAVSSATTGNNPQIAAVGETNLSVNVRGAGTGGVRLVDGAGTMRVEVNTNGLGFFGATPVAKPTGVAVSAAGIHAALVSLGLIAA